MLVLYANIQTEMARAFTTNDIDGLIIYATRKLARPKKQKEEN